MKQTIKSIIRTVKSVKVIHLLKLPTTTALMATLAATAAPKLSEMSEGTKGEKSRNEIDKLIKQAGNFYQDTADSEGRGRLPGQDKFNLSVGGMEVMITVMHLPLVLKRLDKIQTTTWMKSWKT